MKTLYLALGISAVSAILIAATVAWFVHNDRERRAVDSLRDNIEATKETRDAQDALPDDDAGIVQWLLDFAK